MNRRVIVFGATGHLGAHIALHLHQLGYEVIAVGHRKSDNGFFEDYHIPYYSVDISNIIDFEKLPTESIYAIVHFAGILPAGEADFDNATPFISSIIQGTYNVLEYSRRVHADRIVFPQTLFDVHHLFGSPIPISADSERKVPMDSDHTMYVIAKNAAVDMIEKYYYTHGIKRFILRLSRVYLYKPNPFTLTNGKKTMVSDRLMIYQAMQGKNLCVWGDPNRILETCAIGDFLQIVEKCLIANCDGGIYNIGSGGSTLEERVRGIAEVFAPEGKTLSVTYDPSKPSGTQFVLDYSKTTRELGYRPKYTWKSYLKEFKEEMVSQRFAKLWGREEDYITIK